jgi:hypothetical protein
MEDFPRVSHAHIDKHIARIRVRPSATFELPRRHVYSAEDVADLAHGFGQCLSWE